MWGSYRLQEEVSDTVVSSVTSKAILDDRSTYEKEEKDAMIKKHTKSASTEYVVPITLPFTVSYTKTKRTKRDLCPPPPSPNPPTLSNVFQPGIFRAVEQHDVERVRHLLHCWCRTDSVRVSKWEWGCSSLATALDHQRCH